MTTKEQIETSEKKWNDPNFTEVMVYTRPNMRNDEMSFYIGSKVYKDIFDDRKTSHETGNFALIYPERFLNVIEQRMLCSLFWYYYPMATKVSVLTHSVYIIQCTKKECIQIAHFDYQDKWDMSEDVNCAEDFVEGKRRFSAPPGSSSVSFGLGVVELK